MRAGAGAVQQALTAEAASVLRLSLGLARRRGHAQVTPLHVAATLLSPRASLLRRACLKSHPHPSSHPLQCRALELCFNVALNRLPTSPPGPLLHSHPSLSNALIAALKRAQAHQRRGCIEQQQQLQPPLLAAVKVELEQLIISILDDPSVSRVMREAGFSSTCVKSNLEGLAASATPTLPQSPAELQPSFWLSHFMNSHSEHNPIIAPNSQKMHGGAYLIERPPAGGVQKEENLRLIVDVMLRKKSNVAVVGDWVSCNEALVFGLMEKLDRGEAPQELRSVQFVKFQLCPASLNVMKRPDLEAKIAELRRKVGDHASGGGTVIYVGDLKWVVEGGQGGGAWGFCNYNPVEHMVSEFGRLLSDFSSCTNSKVWLMGVANYQTYYKCQMREPPLEVQWALQAVAVPSGGLALSLCASSGLDSRTSLSQNPPQLIESKLLSPHKEEEKLICCPECTSNFEREAGAFTSMQHRSASQLGSTDANAMENLNLPYWMQHHREESHHNKDILLELRRKWSSACQSLHQPMQNYIQINPDFFSNGGLKSYSYSTSYPMWPSSLQFKQNTFADSNSISSESAPKTWSNFKNAMQTTSPRSWPVEIRFENGNHRHPSVIDLDDAETDGTKEVKITLALGNPLFYDSNSAFEQVRGTKDLTDLCRDLQENIYWQSELIPKIAAALLDCESRAKNGTWLLMQGNDWIGNRRLASTVAESLYGSPKRLFHMNLISVMEKNGASCAKVFADALRSDPCQVFLIEEIRYADACFVKLLADGYEEGEFRDPNGIDVHSSHATIIMTTCSPRKPEERSIKNRSDSVIQMELQLEENSGIRRVQPDNRKRKPEWLLPNDAKMLKSGSEEENLSIIQEFEVLNPKFRNQSSTPSLDLNVCATSEDDEHEGNTSDLTQEIVADPHTPDGFLETIHNCFAFCGNAARTSAMAERFCSKLNGSFLKAMATEGMGGWSLSIDGAAMEALADASYTFLESLFERWLKEVFQTSLATVKKGGKEGSVKLSVLEGKMGNLKSGYLDSSLPNSIQVVVNHTN